MNSELADRHRTIYQSITTNLIFCWGLAECVVYVLPNKSAPEEENISV